MAHNIMRVDSMNNRYVTETMIDLNLNLNEEIDFDFFDNIENPTGEDVVSKNGSPTTSPAKLCSPKPFEDDDDVQINPQLLSHDLRVNKGLLCSASVKDINSSTDSIEEPLSTGTENEEKFIDNFDECETSKTSTDTITKVCEQLAEEEIITQSISCQNVASSGKSSVQKDENINENESHHNLYKNQLEDESPTLSMKNWNNEETVIDNCDENLKKDGSSRKSSLYQSEETSMLNENNHEDAFSNSSGSHKTEAAGSGYNSDDGCPLEGSDSDELLLGVHTLTIIPRENDGEALSYRPMICNKTEPVKKRDGHSTSCEKSATTARSSSGYSSASYKAHGCRESTSRDGSRHSSQMKMHSPDMDQFLKSFRKIQPNSPASFTCSQKYSTSKKRSRKNMSFSNEDLQRIERENAILLNKIVLQQRTRPTTVHKYERRVTSHAINRARQMKKIEYDNEILLRKIQDVKRKSTQSTQSSRCTSQASTSQF